MRAFGCIFLLALLCLSQAAWTSTHEITGDASTQLAAGIKAYLYVFPHTALPTLAKSPTRQPPRPSSATLALTTTPSAP
jgi:hypothetical protein